MDYPGASAHATVCPENGCATLTLVTQQRSLAFKYLIHPEAGGPHFLPGPKPEVRPARPARIKHAVANGQDPQKEGERVRFDAIFMYSPKILKRYDYSNFYEGTIFPRDDIRENVEEAPLKTSALPTK